jgi:hypothetical protein
MLLNQEPVPPRPPAAPIEDGPISGRTPAAPAEPVDLERAAFTAGMRQIADFLDQHPAVPLPHIESWPAGKREPTLYIFLANSDDQRPQLATIARAMGHADKVAHDELARLYLIRRFAGIALVASVERDQVCERVVVGTETVEVEEQVCPVCAGPIDTRGEVDQCAADAAHYQTPKLATRTVTAQRDVVEWRCQPLLGGAP